MPKSDEKKNGKPTARGETARSSYRIPPEAMARLDELVAALSKKRGRPENRTTVILELIARDHAQLMKEEAKTKEKEKRT